jgi:catechol 2,3-dioxygenase-like lactoylglutathione lyase family enzyme
MANEVTIPILPSRDLDDSIAFYAALGFERTVPSELTDDERAAVKDDIAHAIELVVGLHGSGQPGTGS